MKLLLLAIVVVVACVPPQQQQSDPATAGGQPGAGCADACSHYLGCKGITDEPTWVSCNDECVAANMDPEVVAEFTQTDCATAIQLVEGEGGMQGGEQGNAPATGECTADCHGCVWDGSQCYYHASSMMGATQACEACCCAEGGPAQRWD